MRNAVGFCLLVLLALNFGSGALAAEPAKAVPNRPVRDKWALIVGIGTFQMPNIAKLKYAAKDARDFRDYLVKEANFAPDHVRILLDEKATQRRVLSELGNKFLARVAKPDDLVVLFFSTHGSHAQADVRGKNFVVAYDSDPEDLYTTGIEMDKILESIQSRVLSERVLLVLDACHSGAVQTNAKGLSRGANFDADALAQGSGQMVICSSEPDQQSWESKRYENGVFTRKLLDALRIKGKRTTLGDAMPYVQQSVAAEVQEDYGSRQSPSLRSKWGGNDLVLGAVPAAPQQLPTVIRELLQPDSSQTQSATIKPQPRPQTQPKPNAAVGADSSPALPSSRVTIQPTDWRKAIFMYRRGDYASAVDILQNAVKSSAAKDADAHFYLANSLIKIGRIQPAVREYTEVFKLTPTSKNGQYALQMINYYAGQRSPSRSGSTVGNTTSSTVNQVSEIRPTTSAYPRNDAPGAASSGVSEQLIAQVRLRLPKINQIRLERPYVTDIMNWTLQERAAFYSETLNRVEIARQQIEEANTLLTKAKAVGGALLPNSRAYGETEETFRAKLGAGQSILNQMLVPYVAELDLRTRRLSDEQQALQACLTAYQTIYGYGATGNVYHHVPQKK